MYQFPIAAHAHARKRPWCIRLRVGPSTVKATREFLTGQSGDVSGVV